MLRRLMLAAILVTASIPMVASVAPASASTADCGYTEACHWIYYYDPGHLYESGWVSVNCLGSIFDSGVTDTPYYVLTTKAC